ncbi:MAG TPA: carbohydrate binding domain-containing protein [Hymenobacter sp.]|jgi:hypothetical protein
MPNYLSAAALLLLLGLGGCASETEKASDTNVLTSNDFEHLDGWTGNWTALATLSKAKAHSGVYSTSVRPGYDFSMGFDNPLGKMLDHRPDKLTVSAWVFVPNKDSNARLVAEIKEPGQPKGLLYEAVVLREEVKKFGEWQQVTKTFTLPTTTTSASHLVVYLWRSDSPMPVYLDDMAISIPK